MKNTLTVVACCLAVNVTSLAAETKSAMTSAFSQTVDRPLFSKSRRAYVPPAKAQPAPEPKPEPVLVAAPVTVAKSDLLHPSDLVLNGVVQRGEHMIALVEQRADGSRLRLKLGAAEVLAGSGQKVEIEVTGITSESLTISAGTPLTFQLRSRASESEIKIEQVTYGAADWAMLGNKMNVKPKPQPSTPASSIMPTTVAQNAGFVVSADP